MKPSITPAKVVCAEKSCGRRYTPYRRPRAGETNRCPACAPLAQLAAERRRRERRDMIHKMASHRATAMELLNAWIASGGREDTGRRHIETLTGAAPPPRAAQRTKSKPRRAGAASKRGKAKREPKRVSRGASRRAPAKD